MLLLYDLNKAWRKKNHMNIITSYKNHLSSEGDCISAPRQGSGGGECKPTKGKQGNNKRESQYIKKKKKKPKDARVERKKNTSPYRTHYMGKRGMHVEGIPKS